jgi:hypothetical protein
MGIVPPRKSGRLVSAMGPKPLETEPDYGSTINTYKNEE